jgi:hypothetical protein
MIQKSNHAVPREDLGEAFREFEVDGMRMIADTVLPQRGVRQKAATLSVTKRENLTIPNVDRANGGTYNRVSLYMDDMAYACKNRGLEGQVTEEDVLNYANDFDAEVEETQNVKIKMRLAREKRVADLVFNTTTWTGASLFTDNSGSPWATVGTDVIAQIVAARELVRQNCGAKPNTLIINEVAMNQLLLNTGIKAKFPGALAITEDLMRQQMAAILGIPNLLIGQAIYNTADEGQTFSGDDIWSETYAMLAVLGTASTPMAQGHLGRTVTWLPYASDLEYVESYDEPQTESEIIRVKSYTDEKVFDANFAHLMQINT